MPRQNTTMWQFEMFKMAETDVQCSGETLLAPCTRKALAKLANIAWQTLLFVSESLAVDKKVTPDLRRKQ